MASPSLISRVSIWWRHGHGAFVAGVHGGLSGNPPSESVMEGASSCSGSRLAQPANGQPFRPGLRQFAPRRPFIVVHRVAGTKMDYSRDAAAAQSGEHGSHPGRHAHPGRRVWHQCWSHTAPPTAVREGSQRAWFDNRSHGHDRLLLRKRRKSSSSRPDGTVGPHARARSNTRR